MQELIKALEKRKFTVHAVSTAAEARGSGGAGGIPRRQHPHPPGPPDNDQ